SADEVLGEKLNPDEAAITTQIADEVEKGIRAQYQPGSARRDVHAKATGFLRAEFRVNDSIPKHLAKGVFVPGKVYQAYLRFSNGSGDPKQFADGHDDGRGLAIKLLGVPGEKILETDRRAMTQDFVMINHPFFFTSDPQTYLTLITKAGGNLLTKLTIPFNLGIKGTNRFRELNSGKISNPLQIQYFSASAFRLGIGPERQAVKWSVKPAAGYVDPMPENPGHDFLTSAMKATLKKGAVTLNFLIQPRTSVNQSVEDTMTEWKEDAAPFHEVATIHIPSQDFDTPEFKRLGETLSFNVWHALPEHRPLGAVNRMRKIVYDRISSVRNQMNSAERREPPY
ncbi:MAG: catalase, partial [Steroidobacteraceae bacterium]